MKHRNFGCKRLKFRQVTQVAFQNFPRFRSKFRYFPHGMRFEIDSEQGSSNFMKDAYVLCSGYLRFRFDAFFANKSCIIIRIRIDLAAPFIGLCTLFFFELPISQRIFELRQHVRSPRSGFEMIQYRVRTRQRRGKNFHYLPIGVPAFAGSATKEPNV